MSGAPPHSVSGETIGVILGAAVAFAVAVAEFYRRRIDRTRDRWRIQDQLEGYRDARGTWHRGTIDTVHGWDDDAGHHPGLDARMDDAEADIAANTTGIDALRDWRTRHQQRHETAR